MLYALDGVYMVAGEIDGFEFEEVDALHGGEGRVEHPEVLDVFGDVWELGDGVLCGVDSREEVTPLHLNIIRVIRDQWGIW